MEGGLKDSLFLLIGLVSYVGQKLHKSQVLKFITLFNHTIETF